MKHLVSSFLSTDPPTASSSRVDPRSRIAPYLALISICAGVFIAADDQTILPQIMLDMKVQVTELDRASWTITGYLVGYLAAMPLIGRLSDTWGHRRLFILSMAGFMIGSAAVALSPTTGLSTSILGADAEVSGIALLIAARVFQALAAFRSSPERSRRC